MSKLEQLEKKVVNACADYALAIYACDDAYASFVDAEAAYLQAIAELKEYTQEQDND
jgi:hypothetical protein